MKSELIDSEDSVDEFAAECLEEIRAHIIDTGEEVFLVSATEVKGE